jgi:hypothetical protein
MTRFLNLVRGLAMIKYYKVTADRLNCPAYYAAYSLKDAKYEFGADTNSQLIGNFEEVAYADIPATSIIHSAKLEFEDARAVACRHDILSANPKH